MKVNQLFLGIIAAGFFAACGGGEESGKEKRKNEVRIHDLSDPKTLNPINESGAETGYIDGNIFQSLLTLDRETYKFVPVLAKSSPVVTSNAADSTMTFTYEIREAAVWDDGSPITANDAAFALKMYWIPAIDCPSMRSSYEMFDDITVDSSNVRKFTVHCNKFYNMAELSINGLTFLNPKVFDPKGVLTSYTVKQLSKYKALKPSDTKVLEEYAKFFNESFNTVIPSGAGSGPYEFEKWETMQNITLKKKQNWWGSKMKGEEKIFSANPDKLIYETINDFNNALVKLKGGKIDVVYSIPARDFVQDLQGNPEMEKRLNLYTPPMFSYDFVGINMKNKKFQDVRVRRAFSHLLDVDKIVEAVCYGLGERVGTFVHPSVKDQYNEKLVLPDFNIEKAKKLLTEAGWKDSNGDGVVDKTIDGEKVEMEVNIMFNNGNERRKKVCIYFLEGAKAAGVKVNVQPKEWSKMLDEKNKHEFELYVGGWISSPLESDPYQVWHSSSYNGGSNDVGFGSAKSDALIEKMRVTMDHNQRTQYNKELQMIISEEVPYIFLFSQKERIGINKDWTNVVVSGLRPGFDPSMFKLTQ